MKLVYTHSEKLQELRALSKEISEWRQQAQASLAEAQQEAEASARELEKAKVQRALGKEVDLTPLQSAYEKARSRVQECEENLRLVERATEISDTGVVEDFGVDTPAVKYSRLLKELSRETEDFLASLRAQQETLKEHAQKARKDYLEACFQMGCIESLARARLLEVAKHDPAVRKISERHPFSADQNIETKVQVMFRNRLFGDVDNDREQWIIRQDDALVAMNQGRAAATEQTRLDRPDIKQG